MKVYSSGKISVFFFILMFVVSCQHDKIKEVPSILKTAQCDTLAVTYKLSVQPILKDSCYSCHSSAISSSQGILDLEDFASLSDYIRQPYQLDTTLGSKFMHVVNQKGSVPDMPPTGKLTDCELSVIGKWIRNGALQN